MEQLDLFSYKPKCQKRTSKAPQEFKVVALRESPHSNERFACETPEHVAAYWRAHVATAPWYSDEQECFVVIFLNTRKKVLGHNLVTLGLLDTVLAHPRETFRAAIVLAAHSVVVAHNHPSGDPSPSEADIRMTRDLIRSGQLLKIELLDHVIVGKPTYASLRELGYFSL
jgi:DNA repair protein RadC